MAMFSNTRSTASSSDHHIVEFKAGRSVLADGTGGDKTKKVIAEPARGLVYIKKVLPEGLVHFCWKNRDTGELVKDYIIFPEEAEFKAVTGCPDGKVFMLLFKENRKMRLFWLQDASPDADKDLIEKVNNALNGPPPSLPTGGATSSSGAGASSSVSGAGGAQNLSAIEGIDQEQLRAMIQRLQNNTYASQPTEPAGGYAGVPSIGGRPSDWPAPSGRPSNAERGLLFGALEQNKDTKEVTIPLADVLADKDVAEIVRQHADELIPLLPQSENPEQELADAVRTPQFRQAADAFGDALQSAQLRPVLEQFGMHGDVLEAADKGCLLQFAEALTRLNTPTPPEREDDAVAGEPEPKRNRPDDQDDMDLD